MKLYKGLLSCVILIACGLHASFFYFLQRHSLSFSHTSSPPLCMDAPLFERMQQKERSLLIGHLFDQLNTTSSEAKQELDSLVPEFLPMATISFPHAEPLTIEDKPFKITPTFCFLENQPEGDISVWESHPVITTAPLGIYPSLPFLPHLFTESSAYEGLEALAGSDHFHVTVEYAQRQSCPGYIFKLTFSPKADITFKRMQQNYFFLIDRSNSIPRARFALNKEVVSKALDYLKPQDSFNIFLFDDKVYRFSLTNVSWNADNVQKARQFLEQQPHGGHFAATELYSALGKIIPDVLCDQEVNTAFLFSDGDTYLSQERQRQTIGKWTHTNQGKVALHAIASGGGNNLPLLELLSHLNKGSLIYSYDHRQLGDRFAQLLSAIRSPIGKEMVATVITPDPHTSIFLYPKNRRLPDLHQNQPFILYGSINRLSDFVVFLQGKYYDRCFDITKRISFTQAVVGAPSIEKIWAQLVAEEFCDRFFEDGNHKHLDAAKQLLTSLQLPMPLNE